VEILIKQTELLISCGLIKLIKKLIRITFACIVVQLYKTTSGWEY